MNATAHPPAADANLVAIDRAALASASSTWLRDVAAQVDQRLDLVAPGWRSSEQAEAARACAFGLLLGRLATLHPHMVDDLSRTAEMHPSFSTLLAGSRLETLQQIVAEPVRIAAWLGPLVDENDPDRLRRLVE